MIMASQTKVEPVEEASASAAPNAAGSAGGKASTMGNDDVEDDEPAHSGMAAAALPEDDEDVSIEELLITDGADDDDDEDDATEVHEGLHRVAMQEISAMHLAEPGEPQVDAVETSQADDADSVSVDLDVPSAEAASGTVEVPDHDGTPPAEERPFVTAETSAIEKDAESIDASAEDLDESPEAAAARATAEQEAVAAAAERGRTDEESDPESSILVSDDAIEADEPDGSEPTPDTLQTSPASTAEATPPPLEDEDREEREVEPESVRADELSDGPLPSFDIPEMDSGSNGARPTQEVPVELETLASAHAVAPLAPLSEEADEDDDDAVTHIGLPVPETAGEYPVIPESGFQATEPAVAALASFDLAVDARRAATRIIPRVDPSQLPPAARSEGADRRADTMRPLSGAARPQAMSNWFASFLRRRKGSASLAGGMLVPSDRRLAWLTENVLPPLSMLLLGSAIGAGIMLLLDDDSQSGQTQTVQALKEAGNEAKRPTTLLERAQVGDGDALFKITNMAPNERTSALTLALEAGSRAQKLNEFDEFSKGLQTPPKELGPALLGRIIAYATSTETMLPTFELLSEWSGTRGPDVMYAIWEKAGSSRAASLAHELLHSADQRAKATPALSAAVDLRAATTCDDYLSVLPAVLRSGDQRCVAALRTLKHTDGCGDDGKQDCYACLRDGSQLDEALAAVEQRLAPAL
jgi:hypothetical protein